MKHPKRTFPKKGNKVATGDSSPLKPTKTIKKKTVKKTFSKKKTVAPVEHQVFFEEYESDDDEEPQIPTVNQKGEKPMQADVNVHTIEGSSDDSDFEFANQEEEEKVDDIPIDSDNEQPEATDEQDEDEEESEEDDSVAVVKKFREEMANLPLSEVRKMREKLGMKLFDKLYFDKAEPEKAETSSQEKTKISKSEQAEKRGQHRPREISSKKKVGTFRNIYKNERLEKKRWDPRFDERAGELKERCFEDNYQFLNDMKKEEREELRKELAKCVEEGDTFKSERIVRALRRMDDQERTRKEKDLKKSAMDDIRQTNIDRMMAGEKPKFLTKAQVRMKVMEKKYEQLKSEKRLDQYMQKKAKKQSQKEKKKKALVEKPFEVKYGYQ